MSQTVYLHKCEARPRVKIDLSARWVENKDGKLGVLAVRESDGVAGLYNLLDFTFDCTSMVQDRTLERDERALQVVSALVHTDFSIHESSRMFQLMLLLYACTETHVWRNVRDLRPYFNVTFPKASLEYMLKGRNMLEKYHDIRYLAFPIAKHRRRSNRLKNKKH